MNRIIAQALDKAHMSLVVPRFHASEEHKAQNLKLLDNPPSPPKKLLRTPKLFLKKVATKGAIDVFHFAFPSRVETTALKNNTVYGRFFKIRSDKHKSTVIMLHGLNERGHKRNEKCALQLAQSGHNCVVLTLPYHIERATKRPLRANQFLSADIRTVLEGLQQAVRDVLAMVNWLTANGEKKISLLGVNLGAYVAGLVASATQKVNYLIMLAPATSALQIAGLERNGSLLEDRVRKTGVSRQQLTELLKQWRLEHHKPLVPAERTLIIEAAHDVLVPQVSLENLRRAWGKPYVRRYQYGYAGMRSAARVLDDVIRFLHGEFAQPQSAELLT